MPDARFPKVPSTLPLASRRKTYRSSSPADQAWNQEYGWEKRPRSTFMFQVSEGIRSLGIRHDVICLPLQAVECLQKWPYWTKVESKTQ